MSDSSMPGESTSKTPTDQTQATPRADSPEGCKLRKTCGCCKVACIVLVIVVLLAIAIFLGWRLLTPKYTARAYLRIAYQEKPLVFSSGEKPDLTEFKIFKNTQVAAHKEPFCAKRVAQEAGKKSHFTPPDPQGSRRSCGLAGA